MNKWYFESQCFITFFNNMFKDNWKLNLDDLYLKT